MFYNFHFYKNKDYFEEQMYVETLSLPTEHLCSLMVYFLQQGGGHVHKGQRETLLTQLEVITTTKKFPKIRGVESKIKIRLQRTI